MPGSRFMSDVALAQPRSVAPSTPRHTVGRCYTPPETERMTLLRPSKRRLQPWFAVASGRGCLATWTEASSNTTTEPTSTGGTCISRWSSCRSPRHGTPAGRLGCRHSAVPLQAGELTQGHEQAVLHGALNKVRDQWLPVPAVNWVRAGGPNDDRTEGGHWHHCVCQKYVLHIISFVSGAMV